MFHDSPTLSADSWPLANTVLAGIVFAQQLARLRGQPSVTSGWSRALTLRLLRPFSAFLTGLTHATDWLGHHLA